MPEMGGIEATQLIRNELPSKKQPIVIALTADAFMETKEKCLSSGMEAVLTKPIKEDELLRALSLLSHNVSTNDRSIT
jgi:CheY-like chemotaxis protein